MTQQSIKAHSEQAWNAIEVRNDRGQHTYKQHGRWDHAFAQTHASDYGHGNVGKNSGHAAVLLLLPMCGHIRHAIFLICINDGKKSTIGIKGLPVGFFVSLWQKCRHSFHYFQRSALGRRWRTRRRLFR